MSVSVKVDKDLGVVMRAKSDGLKQVTPAGVLKAANYAGGEIARTVYRLGMAGTGALSRSFLPAAFVQVPGEIAAGAFSDLVYARIQDEGGTILPKGKNLAIPVSVEAKKRWPRDWGNSLSLIMVKGKKLLVEKIGKAGKFKLHYVLKPSVTIRGKGYLFAAATAAEPKIEEMMAEQIQDGVDNAG